MTLEQRREAPTIPAEAHTRELRASYDPTEPLPRLRLPDVGRQSYPPSPRQQENHRIGGAITVLLGGLLVVGSAVVLVSYAAKHRKPAKIAPSPPTLVASARVVLERLPANAVVAPNAVLSSAPLVARSSLSTSPTLARPPSDPPRSFAPSLESQSGNVESPRPLNAPTAATAKETRKAATTIKKAISRPSVDTETPLIMD